MEDVRQAFGMLGVEVSLVSYQVDSGQAGHVLNRSVNVEDSSEGMDIRLDEENVIKIEVIVKSEENPAVEKSKTLRNRFYPEILDQKSTITR